MMKDIVCGMDISENKGSVTATYKGKEYAFCSPGCRDKFEKSPDQFAQKSNQPNPVQSGQ